MAALANNAALALVGEWAGLRATVVVLIAVAFLIGSIYLLLMSVYGAKQAYFVLMVSLFTFMILLSAIWLFGAPGTVPGTGPRGPEPRWAPFLATSQQAQDFPAVGRFPSGWDAPGKKYGGQIEAKGEVENIRATLTDALAARAQSQGLKKGTKPEDYNFRAFEKAATPEEAKYPLADVRFEESGDRLIVGVTIPATDQHPELMVFAYRDKGRVFQYAAAFLGVSVVGFLLHLGALAALERRGMLPQAASIT